MKLKTLKDLAFVWDNDEPEYVKCPVIKAEAVKWVKKGKIENIGNKPVRDFIIHFFNLTLDDLKEDGE